MKGVNKLLLNQSTIVEAIQEWIDKRMVDYSPKIVTVSYDSIICMFMVVTEEKEAE